jgi:hypothetical protein
METKEYFEKVMQDFRSAMPLGSSKNQHRNGRSLRKYCQDEGIDYKWLQEYKRTYPNETKPVQQSEPESIVGKIMSLLKKIRAEKNKYGALVMRAVNYILDDEEAFKKFLHDGRIEMHNNAVESVFRHIAMGRSCWLNSGSHDAATNIAFMYSLYESCKMNDIDFGQYVEDILTRMMNGDDDYRSMISGNARKIGVTVIWWFTNREILRLPLLKLLLSS